MSLSLFCSNGKIGLKQQLKLIKNLRDLSLFALAPEATFNIYGHKRHRRRHCSQSHKRRSRIPHCPRSFLDSTSRWGPLWREGIRKIATWYTRIQGYNIQKYKNTTMTPTIGSKIKTVVQPLQHSIPRSSVMVACWTHWLGSWRWCNGQAAPHYAS